MKFVCSRKKNMRKSPQLLIFILQTLSIASSPEKEAHFSRFSRPEIHLVSIYPLTFPWFDTIFILNAGIDHNHEFVSDCRLL
jgi:hypothetical protein